MTRFECSIVTAVVSVALAAAAHVGTMPDFEYDQIQITGSAALGGALVVNVDEGVELEDGQSFTFLTANDVSDAFDQIISDATADVTDSPDGVSVTIITQTTCPGDFNNDGAGGVSDLLQLLGT